MGFKYVLGPDCWRGLCDALPVMLAVIFFGALFGATGVSNGLTFWQTVGSSASAFAGASQFVFLDLYNQQVPVWSVLLAVFAVNFRHVLYSASVTRHIKPFSKFQKITGFFFLTDASFAATEVRITGQQLTPSYYFGYALPFYPIWLISTSVGAYLGDFISDPKPLGMDLLLPIYFLVLLMGFKNRPNWLATVLASGIASVLIYKTIGAPWHITGGAAVGILLAAIIGKSSLPIEEKDDV